METIKQTALKYINQGFSVLLLKPKTKVPLTAHGVKDATIDHVEIINLFARNPDANVGIACGNGLHVIDVDNDSEKDVNGWKTIENLVTQGHTLPGTPCQRTPRGGMHYFYKSDREIGNKVNFMPGIDIRSDGGYVAAAPSVHPNGGVYEWVKGMAPWEIPFAEFPSFMLPKMKKAEPCKQAACPVAAPASDIGQRAALYLSECDPAIEGQGGHSKLLWAASALVNGFLLSDEQTFELLSRYYNPTCQPPWDLDTPEGLREFRRKIVEARKNPPCNQPLGWLIEDDSYAVSEITPEMQAMVNGLMASYHAKQSAAATTITPIREPIKVPSKEPVEAPSLDEGVLSKEAAFLSQPTGLLGEICAWINSRSVRKQPLMTLACALTFLGALFGRKIRSTTNLRTNFYCISVASSSSGKDAAPTMIRRICKAAKCEDLIGGTEVASDAAMELTISQKGSVIYLWDELAHMLVSMKDGNSGPKADIVKLLMKLYSSASKTYIGKEYATRDNIKISQPCCCFYGTATPGRFNAGINELELEDGWLGRLLIFMPEVEIPERNYEMGCEDPPESIVKQVSAWYNYKVQPVGEVEIDTLVNIEDGNVRQADPLQITIPTTPEAETYLRNYEQQCDTFRETGHKTSSLWRKSGENARKVALILAASDSGALQATLGNANYSSRLMSYLLTIFESKTLPEIRNNEQERKIDKVKNAIQLTGVDGITKSGLFAETRSIRKNERDAILADLIEAEEVFIVIEKKDGVRKPTRRYWTRENYCKYFAMNTGTP